MKMCNHIFNFKVWSNGNHW